MESKNKIKLLIVSSAVLVFAAGLYFTLYKTKYHASDMGGVSGGCELCKTNNEKLQAAIDRIAQNPSFQIDSSELKNEFKKHKLEELAEKCYSASRTTGEYEECRNQLEAITKRLFKDFLVGEILAAINKQIEDKVKGEVSGLPEDCLNAKATSINTNLSEIQSSFEGSLATGNPQINYSYSANISLVLEEFIATGSDATCAEENSRTKSLSESGHFSKMNLGITINGGSGTAYNIDVPILGGGFGASWTHKY